MNRQPSFVMKEVLVGGFIPRSAHDQLSLFAVYKGVSKAKMVQDFLLESVKKAPSEKEMEEALAKRGMEDWEQASDKTGKKLTWNVYLKEVRRSLSKKITPEHIDSIIEKMEELKEVENGAKRK